MPERQRIEYEELINSYVKRSEEIVKEAEEEKSSIKNKSNPANIIMELRKAANHPLLRRCLYDDEKLKQMAKLVMTVSFIIFYFISK